ncbi:hypothetical protein AWC22_25095 [Mycobacterium riyadhense]|uniref:Uncharacterized protein n=1 Tax=Mycobacterium riyadhense TaxID=486698 RepID=A0A1X2C3H9_9MYCO|nr:hypothetical protein AWC22_25095 [Mycobacterium riyadhense]
MDRPEIAGGEALAGLLRTGRVGSDIAADHVKVLKQALASLPVAWRPDANHRDDCDKSCSNHVGQIARSINPVGRRGGVHGFTHCHRDTHSDDMTGRAELCRLYLVQPWFDLHRHPHVGVDDNPQWFVQDSARPTRRALCAYRSQLFGGEARNFLLAGGVLGADAGPDPLEGLGEFPPAAARERLHLPLQVTPVDA